MTYEAHLLGTIGIGGVPFGLEAVLSSGGQPVFKGAMLPGYSLDFTALVAAVFRGAFSLDPGDSMLPAVSFQAIALEVQKNTYARFACRSEVNWKTPFGIKKGFEIKALQLSVLNRQAAPVQKTLLLSGSFSFGGMPLTAYCYFEGGSPVFIALDQIPAIRSLNDIFSQFLPAGVSWPSHLIDLELTQNRIYYVKDKKRVAAMAFPEVALSGRDIGPEGLNILSTVRISLADHQSPAVRLNVNVQPAGLVLQARFPDPFDLIPGVITLCGSDYQRGPGLLAQNYPSGGKFALDCGVKIGNSDFAAGTLAVTTDLKTQQRILTGYYTTAKNLPAPFGNAAIAFSWTAARGLEIKNLPFYATVKTLIDNARYLKELSRYVKSNGCGEIAGLVFNHVIDTKFIVTPAFATKLPAGVWANPAAFYVVLTGYYKVSIAGNLLVSVPLPTLAAGIKAPKSFSFAAIGDVIESLILDNVENVLVQLWNDKTAMAKLLGVVMGKKALQELAGRLICEGLKKLLQSFANLLPEVALTDVPALLGGVMGALGSIAAVGGGCKDSGSDDKGGGGSDSGDSGGGDSGGGDDKGGGGDGGGGTSPDKVRIAGPKNLAVSQAGGFLYASWEKGDDQASGFEFQLLATVPGAAENPAPVVVGMLPLKEANHYAIEPIAPEKMRFAGAYTFRVKALARGDSNLVNSYYETVALQKLTGPASVAATFDPETALLKATWAADPPTAGYEISIEQSGSNLQAAWKTVWQEGAAPPLTEAVFSLADFHPLSSGPFRLSVRSLGSAKTLPSGFVKAPAEFTLRYGIGTLQLGKNFKIS